LRGEITNPIALLRENRAHCWAACFSHIAKVMSLMNLLPLGYSLDGEIRESATSTSSAAASIIPNNVRTFICDQCDQATAKMDAYFVALINWIVPLAENQVGSSSDTGDNTSFLYRAVKKEYEALASYEALCAFLSNPENGPFLNSLGVDPYRDLALSWGQYLLPGSNEEELWQKMVQAIPLWIQLSSRLNQDSVPAGSDQQLAQLNGLVNSYIQAMHFSSQLLFRYIETERLRLESEEEAGADREDNVISTWSDEAHQAFFCGFVSFGVKKRLLDFIDKINANHFSCFSPQDIATLRQIFAPFANYYDPLMIDDQRGFEETRLTFSEQSEPILMHMLEQLDGMRSEEQQHTSAESISASTSPELLDRARRDALLLHVRADVQRLKDAFLHPGRGSADQGLFILLA